MPGSSFAVVELSQSVNKDMDGDASIVKIDEDPLFSQEYDGLYGDDDDVIRPEPPGPPTPSPKPTSCLPTGTSCNTGDECCDGGTCKLFSGCGQKRCPWKCDVPAVGPACKGWGAYCRSNAECCPNLPCTGGGRRGPKCGGYNNQLSQEY